MKIHGLMVVKNESDVIGQCLAAALSWCDHIYVLDNGSNDGTWEIVKRSAAANDRVVPYKQDDCVFQPSLRADIFARYRHLAREGDWWCRLDADEFYIDNPAGFLAGVGRKYDVVWGASFQYYFTDADVRRYEADPSLYDDSVPVEDKCRWYINNWSERRFVKHRNDMAWPLDASWPENPGPPSPVRIRLKHFQWRSPGQIEKRLAVRKAAIRAGCRSFKHEIAKNWRTRLFDRSEPRTTLDADRLFTSWEDRVVPCRDLYFDDHDGVYVLREDLMPRIKGLERSRAQRILSLALSRPRHLKKSAAGADR